MSGLQLQATKRKYPAPAKINRFLHVIGRDDSGYHRLQTVFQFIDWGDVIEIAARDDGRIVLRGDLSGLAPEQNLAWRAAQALKKESGTKLGAEIHITKRIPAGSGLGGGSSDAATVLMVLNRQWGLRWEEGRLCRLGLSLGADVPVFIHGRACFAEGRGELMRDVAPPEGPICLFMPDVHCATADVFAHPAMVRDSAPIAYEKWPEAVKSARNDCESAALAMSPDLAGLAVKMRAVAAFHMSGTGSSFFAIAPTRKNLRTIGGLVGSLAGHVELSTVTNLSPLHMQLQSEKS